MAKLTIDQIMEAVESGDDMGFCIACGAEAYGVEPDARTGVAVFIQSPT